MLNSIRELGQPSDLSVSLCQAEALRAHGAQRRAETLGLDATPVRGGRSVPPRLSLV